MNHESQLPETSAMQQASTAQELISTKKQWVKPEARILDINSGGDAAPDGVSTSGNGES